MQLLTPNMLKFQGVFLGLISGFMLFLRIRNQEGFTSWRRWVGVVWALMCLAVGVVCFLAGFKLVPALNRIFFHGAA